MHAGQNSLPENGVTWYPMSPRNLERRHLLHFILLLVLAGGMAGCYWPRTPRSSFVEPPYDATAIEMRERIEELRSSPELMLPPREMEYHIGPGDVITMTLVGRTDVFGEARTITITDNPIITLPLIGAIRVHGKTAQQLEDELRQAYSEFITGPIPVVTIDTFFYNQVSVLGAVRDSGRYELEFGDTLVDVIFKAGGLTFGGRSGGMAPARYLKVYRDKLTPLDRAELSLEELLEKVTEDGRIITRDEIIVPIEQLILQGQLDYNIPLMPNDIVYIPPAGSVIVHGRVSQPGITFMGPNLRVLSAVITEAGGLRYSASSRAEIVRTYADGSQETFFLNMRRILRRSDVDFYMQDGDQVFTYVHPVRDVLEWLGNLFGASIGFSARQTYNPSAGNAD